MIPVTNRRSFSLPDLQRRLVSECRRLERAPMLPMRHGLTPTRKPSPNLARDIFSKIGIRAIVFLVPDDPERQDFGAAKEGKYYDYFCKIDKKIF